MTVRPLQPSDIPRILEIQSACPAAASWSEADYRRLQADSGREGKPGDRRRPSWQTSVAVNDERIAGFLTCSAPQGGDPEILNLAVDPGRRRQGVAATLVRKLLREIKDPLFLEVRAGNKPALGLYKKLGFKETGRRRSYYRNPPEDAVIMVFGR